MSKIDITLKTSEYAHYHQYMTGSSPIKRLYIKADELMEDVDITITSEPQFLMTYEMRGETLPRRSNVSYDIDAMLSPIYMVALDGVVDGEIIVKVSKDGEELERSTAPIRVLGYNTLTTLEEPWMLASYVTRSALVRDIATKSTRILRDWKKNVSASGYAGNTKNNIRYVFASVYRALMEEDYSELCSDNVDVVELSPHDIIKRDRSLSSLNMALLMAGVLESMHFNPVIAKAGNEWIVGTWLREECFPEYVIDVGELITKRMAVGVNDFSAVAMSDIFGKIAFESAEKRCQRTLKSAFEYAVDIKRARIGRIYALPERVKRKDGYDLVDDNIYNVDSAPSEIEEYKGDVAIDSRMTKEKQWERRLLDLSMRNALINFRENRNSMRLSFPGIADFVTRFDDSREYTILPRAKGVAVSEPFGDKTMLTPTIDLLNIEMNGGRLHANLDGEDYEKTMLNVYRKDKIFIEESGTNSLYLAVGFLRYKADGDNDPKYSPIFLYPVRLIRDRGSKDSYKIVRTDDEVRVNSTLLEYLFEEYGIDMRGLMNISPLDGEKMLSIIARIRREIVEKVSWDIVEDIYLTNVSFANYLMWTDIKNRIEDFRANPIIAGFIDNTKRVFCGDDYVLSHATSDETYREGGIYLPLSADSSQYSAIEDSLTKSFVLHGPPGTGKSQTITNIIANNILRGRRVLFVAEKMAALSVVEKRLEEIGLGDFCLELHSSKNNKTDVVKKLMHTMSLADAREVEEYTARADEARALIDSIDESMKALHRQRRLGVSVYEGAMRYLENEDATTSLEIEPIFYEKLTADLLSQYEDMLTELVIAGKECGEISSSPFRYMGNVDYDETFKGRAIDILEVLLVEIDHMRDFARKMMDLLKIRSTAVTMDRLHAMYNIASIAKDGAVRTFFKGRDRWHNALEQLARYDELLERNKDITRELASIYEAIPEDIVEDALLDSNERKRDKARKRVARRMQRLLLEGVDESRNDYGVSLIATRAETSRLMADMDSEISAIFDGRGESASNVRKVLDYFANAKVLYADCSDDNFARIVDGIKDERYIERHYMLEYEAFRDVYTAFKELFDYQLRDETLDIQELASYVRNIRVNLDYIPNWCKYNNLIEKCIASGLHFIVAPLKVDNISLDDVLRSFRKSVYGNFVETELMLDTALSTFSGKTIEEKIDKLRILADSYEQLTREEMYYRMVSRIPHSDSEGAHNIELVQLRRAEKGGMKGVTLRKLFMDIPTVMRYACPCLLMSPVSVAQYLDMDLDKFDLVVFDEASQMPTAEAIGAIARAKNVIVVGDPKQLPPTKFFSSEFHDEENMELEDLESILDDCLALGMPERHLLWHYRSQDESLIAFSNAMYYENRLLTFPSPEELGSKVRLHYVDGVYERGGSKRNKKEAEALVSEVIARLKDGKHMSIGIVTFNTAQQNYIDDLLRNAIKKNHLESEAYDVSEPIFVKNLENVQGDERDIILFSVGYGPDQNGKLSLNFGPINQSGGYRRLNVAITRARAEMIVFSSILGNMIDLNRTDNKGVKGLKAFLEYAERGREMLILDSRNVEKNKPKGIGAYIARDLRERGYECEYDVGVSNFKIDVAIEDPKDKSRYILAIMCDGENASHVGSVRDRMTMNGKILKRLGWNVYYLWTVNYINNPKREIQKIRDYLMTFTHAKAPTKKAIRETISRYKRTYKAHSARPLTKGGADYILDEKNYDHVLAKVLDVISVESPIEESVLLTRLTEIYNITRSSKKAVALLLDIAGAVAIREEYLGKVFYILDRDRELSTFRPIDSAKGKREIDEVHPLEVISAMRCILENSVKLPHDELVKETLELLGYTRKTKIAPIWMDNAISIAVDRGALIVTSDDQITT